jgi:chitin disaccharide deacetylase
VNRRLIITADDFGLAVPVNEAVEEGYRRGVLTTTSLLIGERAAADAVERAHKNPGLRVGLHLAVCESVPVLPPAAIPDLVNASGGLRRPLAALVQLLSPHVHEQLEAEIRAQFEAFAATGLTFDHVNGHNHMQLHPAVLPIVIRIARQYGVTAVRTCYEPLMALQRAARRGLFLRLLQWLVLAPWSAYVRRRLLRAGFRTNDYLFGIYDCGRIDLTLLCGIVQHLPAGVSELHCHPATRRCDAIDRTMPDYGHEAELAALLDPQLRAALIAADVQSLAGFSALETLAH